MGGHRPRKPPSGGRVDENGYGRDAEEEAFVPSVSPSKHPDSASRALSGAGQYGMPEKRMEKTAERLYPMLPSFPLPCEIGTKINPCCDRIMADTAPLNICRKPLTAVRMLARYARNPLDGMAAMQAEYGSFAAFPAGPVHFVHCADPDLITEALIGNHKGFDRPAGGRYALSLFDRGGIVTDFGDTWKTQRQALAPHFHSSKAPSYAAAIDSGLDAAAERWKTLSRFDLNEEIGRLAFDIIQPYLLGESLGEEGEVMRHAIDSLRKGMLRRAMTPLPLPWQIAHIGDSEARRARKSAADMLLSRIDALRADPAGAPDSMLAALSATGVPREQLCDQMFQLAVAGHSTLVGAIGYALVEIARRPELQQAVREDGTGALAERVFKEAMRLNPPVYAVMREAAEDMVIGGAAVPKGAAFNIAIRAALRDPRHWPDPERFDPDRFLPEAEAARSRHAYIPFGVGGHRCIGAGLAMQEGVAVIRRLAASHDLAVDEASISGRKPEVRLVMSPPVGSALLITPRGTPAPVPAQQPRKSCPFSGMFKS
jgi:cytochrome P450